MSNVNQHADRGADGRLLRGKYRNRCSPAFAMAPAVHEPAAPSRQPRVLRAHRQGR